MAILTNGNRHVLYVTRTNDDSLGVVDIDHEVQTQRINLSWIHLALPGGHFFNRQLSERPRCITRRT